MESLRRHWQRYALQLGMALAGLILAWMIRQTNGVFLMEAYQFLSAPFQPSFSRQEVMQDARVKELQNRLTELENQNQQFRKILGEKSIISGSGTWAPIIGRSADSWWQQIIIGRGSSDGIKSGAIAVGTGGLVGRVTDVSSHSSRVLLISDPTNQVGVVVSRSRYMGILRGQSQNLGIIEFFDRDTDAKRGDIIATSPFSKLYPAGIPIGRIRSVNLDKQPAPEAIIEFTVPMSLLEFVQIYPKD
ncbi:rod shape-determining protein MreC [Synechococcus sp. PCC 7502]|uniref:rod shape-determining protein MreC n=1 Tax=Synechococcus sp. PCC 7502 TaxID=1173263 RepID=UPI00029FAE38|nr:rod shape-determining protein MreC [Synechococcus sp. PCC 7502]AFY75262.1 rod shape-determining protein MreC [Synechococcus sp. PCC 7502]